MSLTYLLGKDRDIESEGRDRETLANLLYHLQNFRPAGGGDQRLRPRPLCTVI